jgi:Concanavalin A-like lectin/glucanases superfamily
VAQAGGRRTGRWSAGSLVGACVAVVVVVAGGCGPHGYEDKGPVSPSPGGGAPDLAHADLWLSFDDDQTPGSPPAFQDAAGGPWVGVVVAANGGEVELDPGADGTGSAVGFPPTCGDATGCPRAMVEVMSDPSLDPGDHDFEFGASVWLAPDQTTSGSNIVQKGRFDTQGGQWKLQVDSDEGQPSCVVRGDSPDAEPVVVKSKVSISDSAWHRVVCRREGDRVSIQVDGGTPQERSGRTGSVTSDWPVRVGAPGVGDADDQFHGRVDDVFLLVDHSD